jgi:hypothetical protein
MVIAPRCALLVTQTNNGFEYTFSHVSPFFGFGEEIFV